MRRKIDTSRKHIHLVLNKNWFDMIYSGIKKHEYRDISEYWESRFDKLFPDEYLNMHHLYNEANIESVVFSNGYHKNRRQFEIELHGIMISNGFEEWGAEPGKVYYVLVLGDVIQSNF